MKTSAKRKPKREPLLYDQYRFALSAYAAGGGEEVLGRAYELGRRALSDGKSLLEIASIHHQSLKQIVQETPAAKDHEGLLRAGADFLAETLSPYEMAQRGFQDGVRALRQLNETLEQEIKRIASAVHDEAGQLLVAVHLALADLAEGLPMPQKAKIGHVQELLHEVENQLRRYSHELRPTILDDLGWIPAIRFLADGISKRAHLPIQIKAGVTGRLSSSIETGLYRVVQEALTNATKHAKACRVSIRIWREGPILCCSVHDDGVGFDAGRTRSDANRRGLGLIGMQERLNAIGGTLSIDSAPGRGTTILIRLAVEASDDHARRAR